MPGECGRLALRDTLSLGFTGSITLRSTPSVIGAPRCSRQRDAFDLDFVAANEPGAAYGPRRRIDREEAGPRKGIGSTTNTPASRARWLISQAQPASTSRTTGPTSRSVT